MNVRFLFALLAVFALLASQAFLAAYIMSIGELKAGFSAMAIGLGIFVLAGLAGPTIDRLVKQPTKL
ncbi:hypothetical protein [Devosia sp.]|uniref:hypothetical protein n=1 Tax=Devosia sp. TaxID=1871048 RepID=UPI0027338D7D|nr:hypothetical protein [Devosia sp.]MDP2782002.1 hypothetical protein [Devosia sp.]